MRADQPVNSNVASDRRYQCGITGTGAADPAKRFGDGITVTRTATGVYRFAFASHPGYVKGFGANFGADTPSAVKGYTVTRSVYTAPTASASGYFELSVWNSTFAAADLAALQYLDVEFKLSELST